MTYDLSIDAGATYPLTVTVADTDLTGYTARTQFRRDASSADIDFEATTTNGKLVITDVGPPGVLVLTIPAAETAELQNDYVYDMEIESAAGVVTRILQGAVSVDAEVTR